MTVELYLDDSYAKTCEANVVNIDGDKVKLNQTIFYPTGGGQEHDTGFLVQDGNEFEVYKVKKEAGVPVHYVKNAGELKDGPVVGTIDWQRRYGLMRHHTLLHVVAAVLNAERGSLCTGNQIYPDRARIDLTEIHELSNEELEGYVVKANEEIILNHPVSARVLPRNEAEQISGAIKTVVNLIPPFVKEIRLVKIGVIDEQACGGTHVNETAEIGTATLEKTKNKGKGVTRLELKLD
ncbi:alanyl-tRNA editing protein [Alkalihalobacillus sp. AL-G]|uniref:alanyl-tRNA editing protein n=1 Tax=Alkalihalobacillus sp. AL-G TaxID=2926399 RepID=UPI00272B5D24|nr:alanyl-tRNA editing protein [Alkalihalobacillus sp. AL-G]WLD94353.1 alanyl-tRNA editing protein [Alkalihalobacillus sp. AL-G]